MLSIEQIVAYAERTIAQRYLSGEREGLRRLQLALAELMAAAQEAGDKETALRFRSLAAKAANQIEALEGDR